MFRKSAHKNKKSRIKKKKKKLKRLNKMMTSDGKSGSYHTK